MRNSIRGICDHHREKVEHISKRIRNLKNKISKKTSIKDCFVVNKIILQRPLDINSNFSIKRKENSKRVDIN